MSRKSTPVSFASKGRFDVLGMDGGEEVDEEEEIVEEESSSVTETSVAPLSRAARKRLAKLAAKTFETAAGVVPESVKDAISENAGNLPTNKEEINGATEAVTHKSADTIGGGTDGVAELIGQANGVGESVMAQANGVKEVAAETAEKAEMAAKAVKDAVVEATSGATAKISAITNGTLESLTESTASASAATALEPVDEPQAQASSSRLFGFTSTFAPTLPEALPTPSANVLPANRKRKTPQDFTPSGPGATVASSSPSKLVVKFEDGVAPGQGWEGERTMIQVKKKDRNAIERTVWTFIMIGGFITLLCLGHPYMILLVMLCQMLVYKEVTALFELRDEGTQQLGPEQGDKWSKTLNWYFFVVTNYFLYGESIIYYFKHIVFVDAYFIPFARNHRFISFMLYVVGFVGFVGNLQRQYLRQQFALFCWVHISLLLIVVSSHFIINNILEGLIWFFVPASLVICNDVMAYVCGKLFGRTPLIKLSPKKTVEGFVGAFICTLIFGLAWGTFFMRYPYMICPARDLGANVLSQVTCRPNPVFLWRDFEFTGPTKQLLQTTLGHAPPSIPYAPFQLHVLVMATFASLVAPFGGFFASGFKRAFNVKDFGHSIPGHGGMTDRMDCQFMMGLFSYVYYSSLIRIQNVTVGSIMQTVVTSFTTTEQLELLADLKRFLEGQGVRVK